MTRAERIRAVAIAQGPLGVCQNDFDHPARDHQPQLPGIADIIRRYLADELVELGVGRDRRWVLPVFVPAGHEYFRSGWGCLACGARHYDSWPSDECGSCGSGPLIRARVLARTDPQEAAA